MQGTTGRAAEAAAAAGAAAARTSSASSARSRGEAWPRFSYPKPDQSPGPPASYNKATTADRGETPRIVPPPLHGNTKGKDVVMGGYDSKTYGKPEPLPKGSAYMQPDYPTTRYEYEYAKGVGDVERGTAPHQFPWTMDYKYEKGGDAVVMPGIKDHRMSNEPPTVPPSNGPENDARSGVYGDEAGNIESWHPPVSGDWAPNSVDPGWDPTYPASQMPTTATIRLTTPWLASSDGSGSSRVEEAYTGRNWNLRYREGAELDTFVQTGERRAEELGQHGRRRGRRSFAGGMGDGDKGDRGGGSGGSSGGGSSRGGSDTATAATATTAGAAAAAAAKVKLEQKKHLMGLWESHCTSRNTSSGGDLQSHCEAQSCAWDRAKRHLCSCRGGTFKDSKANRHGACQAPNGAAAAAGAAAASLADSLADSVPPPDDNKYANAPRFTATTGGSCDADVAQAAAKEAWQAVKSCLTRWSKDQHNELTHTLAHLERPKGGAGGGGGEAGGGAGEGATGGNG